MSHSLKTKKAALKRIVITRQGKLLRRKMGQDHFRARHTSKEMQRKNKEYTVSKSNEKILKSYLPGKVK